ncbi:M20 family metallo-hydrolase [Limibacillus sp. MBR-115]|jgi:N-carbamoyl-L-amino-acid hydrolase|uniref:M20 family metallo-hydrolase n=1 Tax=Limibacillus sp. MBR-115 TaxID=3156465 RepID=UPI0033941903
MMIVGPAAFVDEARIWHRLEQLAEIGATPGGGVNRQALSEQDARARLQLAAWAKDLGLSTRSDPAGNIFLVLEGSDPDALPILTGSHIDSQPTGGRFDGAYGVVAGLEAVQAVLEAGQQPRHTIEVVAWMNEEGSRFAPGMMGSAAFAGARGLNDILAVQDDMGISVKTALASMPGFPEYPLRRSISAYLEAHIEQGPILEREGLTVGIVTGIQGKHTYRVTVEGEEAHAGTALEAERKDALFAAIDLVQELRHALHDPEDRVRFTIGAFTVRPNAPSVVPSSVVFSIDLRHPEQEVLVACGAKIEELCQERPGPCRIVLEELSRAASLSFPQAMQDRISAAADALGIPSMRLASSAGHDARYLHQIAETGMIFVPCRDGVSHREDEWASPAALADGAKVLADVLYGLALGHPA